MKEYSQDNDIIILLQSDHGNAQIRETQGKNGAAEYKLPAFFLIANKNFLNRFPNSYHALHENTHRLILKTDIRHTMLSIIGRKENTRNTIDLLTEIAPHSRNCEMDSMKPEYCCCDKLQDSFNYIVHARLLEKLISYAEFELNSILNSYQDHFTIGICEKIILSNIISVVYSIENEFYRIRFTSLTKKPMIFQIDFYVNSYNNRTYINWDSQKAETLFNDSSPIQIRVNFM